MNRFALRSAVSISAVLLSASFCSAATESIPASNSGHISFDGNRANGNYIVGYCGTCGLQGEYRDFFVFDLSDYHGIATSAVVSVPRHNTTSPDISESLLFHEVTTSASALYDGSAGVAGFTDLGDGPILGSTNYVFPVAIDPILFPLTNLGVDAVNDAAGGDLVLGGRVSTITGTPGVDEIYFGASSGGDVTLILDGASCPSTPASGCSVPAKSILKFKANVDPAKQSFGWKWLKGTVAPGEFGLPLSTTAYALCVYKDGATLISSSAVAGAADWTGAPSASPTKFKFKPDAANNFGVTQTQLAEGTGKAKIQVKGKGANVDVPTLPTAAASLQVQLLVDSDTGTQCWESNFTGPFAKDDASGLVAK